jgi:hypothetical protein
LGVHDVQLLVGFGELQACGRVRLRLPSPRDFALSVALLTV